MKKSTIYKGLVDYDATARQIWEEKGWSITIWAARSGFGESVSSVRQIFRQVYLSPSGKLPQRVVAELRRQGLAVEWPEDVDTRLAA
jgi:hypothetical protein